MATILIDKNVMVPMRDGVRLATDVYRLDGAALEQPPALQAIAPLVTPSDMYEGSSYQGGVKALHDLRWAVEAIAPEELRRRVARGEVPPDGGASLDLGAALAHLPLNDHPLLRDLTPFYGDRLAHPTADAYWRPISPCAGYEQISAPALNISGEVQNTRAGTSA